MADCGSRANGWKSGILLQGATGSGTGKNCAPSYDALKAMTFGKTYRYTAGEGGCCAGFVKRYMRAGEGGKLQSAQQPFNGCEGAEWLSYWGFKCVYQGKVGEKNPVGFEPQDGDILVAAGSSAHPYGHIQIYSSEKADGKNWVSDIMYANAGVYGTLSNNLFVIYRK